MRITRILIGIIVTLCALGVAKAADVYALGSQDGVSMMLFDGAIQSGDLTKVKTEYSKARRESSSVYMMLASPGGSVDEAMKIGDFLEQEKIGAIVPSMIGECISACVLILAGGEDKWVKGKIGIHRPYIENVSIGGDQGAKTLGQYVNLIKRYLDGKGIPPSLADDMFSVPPEKIKYLSPAEVSNYRLDQRNYLKQEALDIEIARSYGLTRQQYMQKKNQMNRECAGLSFDQMAVCTSRIMGPRISK